MNKGVIVRLFVSAAVVPAATQDRARSVADGVTHTRLCCDIVTRVISGFSHN